MANILLGGLDKPTGLDSAFRGFQMGENVKQAPLRNQLLQQQVAGNDLAMRQGEQGLLMNEQQMKMNDQALTKDVAQFQLKDAATDAIQIKQLAQTDPMRAQVAIAQRIKKIQDRGGDASDTIALREALTSGNMALFNSELDSVIGAAEQVGLLNPNGITEYQQRALDLQERRLEQENQITPSQRENLRLQQERLDFERNKLAEDRAGLQNAVDSMPISEEEKRTLKNLPTKTLETLVSQENSPANKAKKLEIEQEKAKAQELTDKTKALVTELLNNIGGVKSTIGALDELTPNILPSSRNAQAAMDDLKNLLTVDNLKLMSGVLSESDIKILRSVGASGLSGSQDRVIGTLKKMGEALGVNVGGGQSVGRFKIRVKQ